MTLRFLPKVFCYIAIALFWIWLCPQAKAEVYGYILTVNVQANGEALQSGQSVSKDLAKSGEIKVFFKVIDPSDPQRTFQVDKWDIAANGISASTWNLENIKINLNNYSADLVLTQEQIQTGVVLSGVAYVSTHKTNDVSFKLNVTKTAIASVTPTATISPQEQSPTPPPVGKDVDPRVIPPLAMAVSAAVSIGLSSSMAILATSLVINGATPFIPSMLRLLLLIPLGLTKRNRPKWGKVISASNHEPIKFIPIELIRVEEGIEQVVAKNFSDEDGDYGFNAKVGQYKIRPAILEAKIESLNGDFYKEDDLIEIKKDGESPIVNPLLLSSLKNTDLSRAIYFSLFKSFQTTFLILAIIITLIGTLISLYVIFIQPTILNGVILLLYAILWFIMIPGWLNKKFSGRVIDQHTRLPIPFAVVRIMNENGTSFIRGAITNEKGEFTSVLKKGRYMILSGKEGYRILRPKIFTTNMHSIGLIEMLPE